MSTRKHEKVWANAETSIELKKGELVIVLAEERNLRLSFRESGADSRKTEDGHPAQGSDGLQVKVKKPRKFRGYQELTNKRAGNFS